jgi:hypothetical protein
VVTPLNDTSDFAHRELLHSGYVTVGSTFGRLSLQGGARGGRPHDVRRALQREPLRQRLPEPVPQRERRLGLRQWPQRAADLLQADRTPGHLLPQSRRPDGRFAQPFHRQSPPGATLHALVQPRGELDRLARFAPAASRPRPT